MTDVRSMFDKDFIGAWSIKGDTVVTIKGVKAQKIRNAQDKENKKPVIFLDEFDKPFVCNVTNANTISSLYGRHVEQWAGKKITLYVAQVTAFGKTDDCIRIRPTAPAQTSRPAGLVFIEADGTETKMAKGGDWLDAAEKAVNEADAETCGKLWDANQDTFYSIQAAITKKGDAAMTERVGAVGKAWQLKMNATLAAE